MEREMTTPEIAPTAVDERVLVLAPTGRDSQLLSSVLSENGVTVVVCATGCELAEAAKDGAGAAIVAEEALTASEIVPVLRAMKEQPAWSDLAIILLASGMSHGGKHDFKARAFENSIMLERPVSMRELVSAVRVALRARRRQYEVRRYLETVERIQEDLRRANGLKDEFLALVSHELRTPLTTIIGAADLLYRRWEALDEDSRIELISDVSGGASRLQRLVENMLVLSKAEASDEIVLEPILVQRTLPAIVHSSGAAQRVVLNVQPGLPPVTANQTFFEQIIANLIRNAEKYGDPSSGIEVNAEAQGEYVVCSVADRGQAFDASEIEQLFQPFYRDVRTAGRASGLGLGLTVCKRLAEVQRGRIHAKPRAGGGLEIVLEIPIDPSVTDGP